MGRFDHEKKAASWGGGAKPQRIGSPKKSKQRLCPKCGCYPCAGRFECKKGKKATGKDGGCIVAALVLLGSFVSLCYGAYELVGWLI